MQGAGRGFKTWPPERGSGQGEVSVRLPPCLIMQPPYALSDALGHMGLHATRRSSFGANVFRHSPPKRFLVLVWETIQDPVIILLIVAATVRMTLNE